MTLPFLQVALNGDSRHPAVPREPSAIAESARAAVEAGADSVHVHAFDDLERETLDGTACASVLRAIRACCPDTPISLTTSAAIEPDARERLCMVEHWEELPDLVSANQGEPGIVELCELLLSRGVGIEAGLLCSEDARAFVRSGLAGRCRRVLIEPLDQDAATALAHAAEMETIVVSAGIALEQVHHGYGTACWAVNRRALERGHGIRTGLEDVSTLPDGSEAPGNAALVAAAARLIQASVDADARFTATELAAALTVRDLAASEAWYAGVLGFSLDRRHERAGTLIAVSLRAGQVRLLLAQDDGAHGTERVKGAGTSLQLTTSDDIDALAARIQARGGTLESEPMTMPWGVRVFRIRDPDGFRFTISSPQAS